MKKVILDLILIVVLAGAFYEVKHFNTSTSNSSTPYINSSTYSPHINPNALSSKAIDFKLKDLNGKDVSLSGLKGKRVFLNFWASWCPPCRGEMPDIEKLYEETNDSDLVITAINLGDDKGTARSFIDKNNYKFKVLLDSDEDVAQKWWRSSYLLIFTIFTNSIIINIVPPKTIV